MHGQHLQVHLSFQLHPVVLGRIASENGAGFEEQVYITSVDLLGLDHDSEANHHLEGEFVNFEEVAIDVAVNSV